MTKILFALAAAFLQLSVMAQSWTNAYPSQTVGGIPGPFIVLDQSGNAYLTGSVADTNNSLGYVTIKYSCNGVPLWTNLFCGSGYTYHGVHGIALGSNGAVYVTGGAAKTDNIIYSATVAYSSFGEPLWTNWYDHESVGCGVATGSNGVVYVVVGDGVAVGNGYYVTIAYSNNGDVLWTNRFAGPGTGQNIPVGIAVASNGNIYVTGVGDAGKGFKYETIAYASHGDPLWTNYYPGAGVCSPAVDKNNCVYVTGGNGTLAYAGDGTSLWTNEYSGWASAIAVDAYSNSYVTGSVIDSDGFWDYSTIKYSPAGLPLWTNLCPGTATFGNMANALALDSSGNVYVTGESGTDSHGGDFLTVAYSTDGIPLWTNRFNGIDGHNDIATAIALDNVGDVYLAGVSDVGGYYEHTTIKRVPSLLVLNENVSSRFHDGHFSFLMYGRIGSRVAVESSSDFQHWSILTTNIITANLIHFTDSQPVSTDFRFYRTQLLSP